MKSPIRLALVGATGAVGAEVLQVLQRRHFPLKELRCFASSSSKSKTISFNGQELPLYQLDERSFNGIDIAIFCANTEISKQFAKIACAAGAVVIDKSSAFRLDPDVPLVIPEVNGDKIATHKGIIASPNCTAILMLLAIAPLHREFGIERVVVSTYQAVSGGGKKMLEQLLEQTKAFLHSNTPSDSDLPLAFNVFLHESPMQKNRYVDEEMKLLEESRKILEDPTLKLTATCVRVPVLRAHAESINIQCKKPIDREKALAVLKKAPGLTILENWEEGRFPMPKDATGQDQVFCGRIRDDHSQENTIELWVVGDQLLKGAALNAVQIVENLLSNN